MPVVELNNQLGPASGIGMALGAVGGYLASNNQRKQAKEQRDYDRARQATQDKEAAQRDLDYHNEITSTIAERNAASGRLNDDALNKRYQSGALTQYGALMQNPPKGLKGQALAQWVHGVQQKAFTAGLTDPTMMGQLAAQGQQIIQDRQPSIADVEHGLPQQPAPGAKNQWTPQQVQQHFMQAAARVISSPDLPPDQKKLYAQAYSALAADAVKNIPKPETPEQAFERAHGYKMPTYADKFLPHGRGGGRGRGSGGGTPGTDGLSPQGAQFLQMLTASNNRASRREALAALNASNLSPSDKAIIQARLENAKTRGDYVVPDSESSDYVPRGRGQAGPAAAATGLEGNSSFVQLPSGMQAEILKQVKRGVSKSAILNDILNSDDVDDDVKATVKAALSGN